jgi:hypothetical protein
MYLQDCQTDERMERAMSLYSVREYRTGYSGGLGVGLPMVGTFENLLADVQAWTIREIA